MVEKTDLMLEHLRAIRGDLASVANDVRRLKMEMTRTREILRAHLDRLNAT
jgi:hypothetical protein